MISEESATTNQSVPHHPAVDIPLNPQVHGRARVPGQPAPDFDLNTFARALEHRDTDYLLTSYAPGADVRIVDPDNPGARRLVQGKRAIREWLLDSVSCTTGLRVTQLVDGGDRVAFTEHRRYADGATVISTSTAELFDGLITTQHTLLVLYRY